MAEITHLPSDCSLSDIVDVVEKDGAVIVDDFVTRNRLSKFIESVKSSIEFLGRNTVRLNGIVSNAPCHQLAQQ